MLGGARLVAVAGWLVLEAAQCFCKSRTETDMEWRKQLAGLVLAFSILQGNIAEPQSGKKLIKVNDSQEDGSVLLMCDVIDNSISWFKDEVEMTNEKTLTLNLGSSLKDPQGTYRCQGSMKNNSQSVQVYYRMCENCIELNAPTVSGFIFAEIVSIFLLAIGVYFIAGQDGVRQSRASDKQTLLSNDQLYQPLKDREDDQYSHLQGAQLRRS